MIARLRKAFRAQLVPLVLGFVVLALIILGRSYVAERQAVENQAIRTAFGFEQRLNALLGRLQDAETGQRGYLLTGESGYLKPYSDALSGMAEDLDALAGFRSSSPTRAAQIDVLKGAVDAKLGELAETLALFDTQRTTEAMALVRSDRGRVLMDRIREIVSDMRRGEDAELQQRLARSEQLEGWMRAASLLALAAVSLVGVFGALSARRWLAEIATTQTALSERNTALSREIETREAAEAQVRQMQKMEAIGQLTGGIAHDFNNMLAVIISAMNLAQRRLTRGDTDIGRFVDAATDAATRAAGLTSRLLAFSRQQPLAPQVIDPNRLVSGMSELLHRSLGESIAIETVLAGGLWRIHADTSQLENALLNLAVNARDAMPDGGRLTIETANAHLDDGYAARHQEVPAGQYVLIAVSDTGTGMPAEIVSRAFDPFFTTKGVNRGTGLGLSQVHGFVKQSGGHVKIYSEAGQGTTVKIYLPRYFGEGRVEDPRPAPDLSRAPSELVLVVEDDDRVRASTVAAVRELGYSVLHAANSAEALSRLETNPGVTLLFTDVVMPGTSGRALAEAARSLRPDLKVLFTTGFTRNAVVHNGVLDPEVHFIAKPFTLEALAAKLREVIDG